MNNNNTFLGLVKFIALGLIMSAPFLAMLIHTQALQSALGMPPLSEIPLGDWLYLGMLVTPVVAFISFLVWLWVNRGDIKWGMCFFILTLIGVAIAALVSHGLWACVSSIFIAYVIIKIVTGIVRSEIAASKKGPSDL
jgi:hypothetical protein